MAVAAGIAATVMTTAALVMGGIGLQSRRLTTYGSIELGNQLVSNYYPNLSGTKVDAYTAPNYGRAASADMLRAQFWNDINNASAVYCLGRTNPNTIRSGYIPFDNSLDGRDLDTPEAFRLHLANVLTQSSLIFQSWRGVSAYDNGSIFIIQPSIVSNFLAVRAVYDIDVKATTSPPGTYVSVKRFSQNKLTDYYDVFYAAHSSAAPFKPMFALHERRARLRHSEGTAIDNYKVAADMPFYFVWWPDPASPVLSKQTNTGDASLGTIGAGDLNPLPGYGDMAGRTSYFFTVPMFPSQL
jgi:hypothetical protein